ncbi:MAG: tRNA(Ile)(2)-agmatinylcytidine synthase [Candidatus Verstraetearchaeota archaeon]|nr:tRNA(Ile)(2)-agmatinylcytidine synthase [Candidatus Verstraetearchaeota archaeon]
MPTYHLAIDDTDSLRMGCTTYVGALIVERLLPEARFVDYPNLIRLNPNVPWKSRGNAAVCLRFSSARTEGEILELAASIVEENRDRLDGKNQPGIALLEGEVPPQVKEFGRRALFDVLSLEEAYRVAAQSKIGFRTIRGGRGLIGAVAAIGNTLEADHTFELIVYRKRDAWGSPRKVDAESVRSMDKETAPHTFNNIDPETNRILITPHGPDPILFGIRGESPGVVIDALGKLVFEEGEKWIIYRSNQGTDAHMINRPKISSLTPYQAAVIEGAVSKKPVTLRGGHTIVEVADGSGCIDAAAYQQSGDIERAARALLPGDIVRVYGGVRVLDEGEAGGKLTLNLERLDVLELVDSVKRNPLCPRCGVRMKAKGRNKGFECEKCGKKSESPVIENIPRQVRKGTYLPPPRSLRHLAKPPRRLGLEKLSWDGTVGRFFGSLNPQHPAEDPRL